MVLLILPSCFPAPPGRWEQDCVFSRVLVSTLIQLGTGKGREQLCSCADREGSKNCRRCGLGLLVQREGSDGASDSHGRAGEGQCLCLEVGVISRKTRGRVLQPHRELLGNCPKKQL